MVLAEDIAEDSIKSGQSIPSLHLVLGTQVEFDVILILLFPINFIISLG